jgi:catechol-2,3-dioxygenase
MTDRVAHVPVIDPGERPRPAYMAHVVLRTQDKARLVQWYGLVLGAQVVFENALITFVTFDGEHHRLAFIENTEAVPAPAQSIGIVHFAYSYKNLDDLIQTYERLSAAGIRPNRVINHGTTTSLYYPDPDGNTVEMQVDNFSNRESLNAWYAAGHFTRNPIGIEFDIEALIARRRAGSEPQELLRPWSDNALTQR